MARHPLIAECAERGIVLTAAGPNGLVVEPADRMTPELRERLVAAKPEILAVLRAGDDTDAWNQAGRIVDQWIARLAADARRRPLV